MFPIVIDTEPICIAHKKAYHLGVLHRDISPSNILITKEEGFEGGLLIDWDMCKLKEHEGRMDSDNRLTSRTVCFIFGYFLKSM